MKALPFGTVRVFGGVLPRVFHSVQAARFLAACMVLYVHCFNFALQGSPADYAGDILYFTRLGNAGVHVFFVISGFIIVYASRDEFGSSSAIVPFLVRRFLRIFPIFWILSLVNIAVRTLMGTGLPDSLEDYLLTFLLYPGHSSDLIFVGWSLSYEIVFYLVAGALMVFSLARAVMLMTVIFLSLAALGLLGIGKDLDDGFWTNALFAEFVFGAWVALLVLRGHRAPPGLAMLSLLAGVGLLLAGLAFDYTQYPRALIWGAPSVLFLYGCVHLELAGRLPGWIARLKGLGDASYTLYLLHAVLMPLIAFLITPWQHVSLALVLALAAFMALISILASVWMYQKVERPILRWSRKLVPGHRSKRSIPAE